MSLTFTDIFCGADQRYTLAPSPAAMTALVALAKAGTILLGRGRPFADSGESRRHLDRTDGADQGEDQSP